MSEQVSMEQAQREMQMQQALFDATDRIRELETEIGRHNMCLDSDAAEELETELEHAKWLIVDQRGQIGQLKAQSEKDSIEGKGLLTELERAKAERDAAMDAGMDLTRRLTDACVELERAKAENARLRDALKFAIRCAEGDERDYAGTLVPMKRALKGKP